MVKNLHAAELLHREQHQAHPQEIMAHPFLPHLWRSTSRFRIVRDHSIAVLVWFGALAATIALSWTVMLTRLDTERQALERASLDDAAAIARSYAQYLKRSVEQIDQVSLLIKHQWEESHDAIRLEWMLQNTALLNANFTIVVIIDRNGVPISGQPVPTAVASVADREYFKFHRDHDDGALRISQPATGRVSGKRVIQLTRRLQDSAGNFDGVALVSIEPSWFAMFRSSANLGQAGLMAVAGNDGVLRMASISNLEQSVIALKAMPPLPANRHSNWLPGSPWFADAKPRFLGWEAVPDYPLTAVVGLAVEERMASFRASDLLSRKIAAICSVLAVGFAGMVMALWWRNAWQRHQHAAAQEAYRIATEGGLDGFYSLHPIRGEDDTVVDFRVIDCNERGAAFNGVTAQEFIGKQLSQLYPKPYFHVVMATFCSALENGYYEDELKIPPESPVLLEWVHRRLVRTSTGLAMTMRDISAVKAHERDLWRMANEDALTALPNRHWLKAMLPDVIEQARHSRSKVAILFVDLDDFKNVNDSLGHSAGDELLQIAALRLQSVLRPGDNVVRLGGDEFTVILLNLFDRNDAAQVAQRITDAFSRPFQLRGGTDTVGTSIGISVFPDDGNDVETLLKNSDIAMYHAKGAGKNHFQFYETGFGDELQRRLAIERALHRAIEHNEFVLFYQPRVSADTGQLLALEVLVRWIHPVRGMVLPLEFIPVAEETGLILPLGELIAELACVQLVEWRDAGLPVVPLSINVSPHQFNHGKIKAAFTALLTRHQLEATLLEIEITESSMMGQQIELTEELMAIRALGIKLLVDDFGTGYSSLAQLQRLDMDGLKVDRAFTDELGRTAEGEVFFRAIVSMAHALGMTVVAEGVETAEQLRILQALNCDEVQGYYVARPMAALAIPALLTQPVLLQAAQQSEIPLHL